ncbi:MAG: hypothetical protein JNN07_00005 [Verrucomicrobiales bacterium]|nr:hypothetical protein [Verrucomicrobiales bacterium]
MTLRTQKQSSDTLPAEGLRVAASSNMVAWTEAVAARDGLIKEANLSVERVARERNERIEAFNRLAEKHNAAVQRLNEALAKLVELRTNAPAKAP